MNILGLHFANPQLLESAAAVPVVLVMIFLYDRMQRRSLQSRLGELPVLVRVMASSSPRRRWIKLVGVCLALMLIMIAAARPQIGGKRKVPVRGLDLVVAVDVSKSMLVDDVGQTLLMQKHNTPASRLARARELAGAMMDELPDDRIGPVVFAGAASHFPVTEDHEVAIRFIYDLGPADLPPGSNLSEVFRVSRCLLRPDLYDDLGCARIGRRGHGGDPLPGDTEGLDPPKVPGEQEVVEEKVERGKAMVIFTDGGDSDEEALREVATSRELGIAVFIVGVGTQKGGVVYDVDFEGKKTATPKVDADGQTVVSKRDDGGMKLLAQAGGDAGRFFIASETGEVDPMPIVEALKAVNRGQSIRQVNEMKDIFEPFLFAGLMLLVIEAAISTRRRRKYPEEHQ